MEASVAVVGAGVMGLSTAVCILQRDSKVQVTVIAEKFSPDTCTDGSGGVIMPWTTVEPKQLQRKWFHKTRELIQGFLEQEVAPEMGLFRVTGFGLFDRVVQPPEWKYLVPSFHTLTQEELADFPPFVKSGYKVTVAVLQGGLYLKWLMNRFKHLGGHFVKRKLKSLGELSGSYDVIVNSSGLGARELVGDQSVVAVRGQVLRVEAPFLKHFYFYDCEELTRQGRMCYIIPQVNEVVLGGTKQEGDFNDIPTEEDTSHILRVTSELVPSLKRAKVLEPWVGLRPYRTTMRVEKEIMTVRDKQGNLTKLNVVHNYGQGGTGLTVHWGCATDSTQHVFDYLTAKTSHL